MGFILNIVFYQIVEIPPLVNQTKINQILKQIQTVLENIKLWQGSNKLV